LASAEEGASSLSGAAVNDESAHSSDREDLFFFTFLVSREAFCDLLGGASLPDVCANWTEEEVFTDARLDLPSLATRFTKYSQFHFADSGGAVAPLETLWLKWRLLATASGAVLRIHSETQRPLLSIQPHNLCILFPEHIDPLLPSRWQFTVQIADSNSAVPVVPDGLPSGVDVMLFRPTAGMEESFQSPEIRYWPLGQSEVSTVLIRSLEQIRHNTSLSEPVQGIVRLHILGDKFSATEFSDQDMFRVTLSMTNGNTTSIAVWGKKVGSVERGLIIDGKTEPISMRTWECLQSLQHDVWNQTRTLVYRSFHVPSDLYSLGMLSLHTVLCTRGPEKQRLVSLLPEVMEAIQKIVTSVGPENSELLHARLGSLLKEYGGLFSKRALLYPGVSAQAGAMKVSDDVWDKVLLFAFRLMTRVPGFSFCHHAGDYIKNQPHCLMEDVMSEVMSIGEDLNKELFKSQQRNREILSVCQQLREERARVN